MIFPDLTDSMLCTSLQRPRSPWYRAGVRVGGFVLGVPPRAGNCVAP